MRCAFAQNHRSRETALLIEPDIGLLRQFFDAPLNEKLGRDTLLRCFVRDMLCPFFAEFEMRTLAIRLGPGASGTIDSLLLIEAQERSRTAHNAHLAPGKLGSSQSRARAAGDFCDWVDFWRSRFNRRLRAGSRRGLFLRRIKLLSDLGHGKWKILNVLILESAF